MEFKVKLWFDGVEKDEIPMWIAESDDIVGLILENESLDELILACKDLIPDLLIGNKQVKPENIETIRVNFSVNYSWNSAFSTEKISAYG